MPHLTSAQSNRRLVALWLFGICALLALMVVVGGATRLTESGLSITEWKPVSGTLPPLSQAAWEAEFEKYRQIPEYQVVNRGMSLADFKAIYWWEWGHRLLGRLIGLAFLLPFVVLLALGRIERALVPRLVFFFALGGSQGVLGWWMVSSGLSERIDVSQYRLAAHLGLAVVIFGLILWCALGLWRQAGPPAAVPKRLSAAVAAFCALVFVQIVAGAFVAGLRAGHVYNTWPLMGGRFVPPDYGFLSPWYANVFENHAAVQFNHRLLAYIVVAAAAALWVWGRRAALAGGQMRALDLVAGVTLVQAALGIATLVAVVPIPLGVAHQAGAIALFAASLFALHRLTAHDTARAAEPAPADAQAPASA